jgi:low temperature requirement protein LtrA
MMNISGWLSGGVVRGGLDESPERKVDWLELFFDLFFVVIISQLAHGLADNPTWAGFREFVFLFASTWWVWLAGTYFNERFRFPGTANTIFTFLQMLPVAGMAIFVHHGMGDNFVPFEICFLTSRIMLTLMWFRGGLNNPHVAPLTNRVAITFIPALFLYLLAIFNNPPIRYLIWVAGLITEVMTPVVAHTGIKIALPKFGASWLAERYGLFILIVMGETLVGVIRGASEATQVSFTTFVTAILGLALSFGVFRIYFDFIGRRNPRKPMWWMLTWSNLHFLLVMSIVVTGVGLLRFVQLPDLWQPCEQIRILLAGATATTLIIIALLETTMQPGEGPNLHPVRSPLFKIIAGLIAAALCLWATSLAPLPLLLILLALTYSHLLYHPGWEGVDTKG